MPSRKMMYATSPESTAPSEFNGDVLVWCTAVDKGPIGDGKLVHLRISVINASGATITDVDVDDPVVTGVDHEITQSPNRVSALSHDVHELQQKTKTLPPCDIAAELDALKACIESWRKQTATTQEWVSGVDDYCNVARAFVHALSPASSSITLR